MGDYTVQHEIFARFAEHLVPEAFETPTRADRAMLETAGPSPTSAGDGDVRFDRWIDARIKDALAASWPHHKPEVVIFTSDGTLLRRYDGSCYSHLRCVVALVQNELASIDTPWVFGAVLPRPEAYWHTIYDEDGNEIDEVLREPSETRWAATWYAEARGGGMVASRAGYLYVLDEEVTSAGPLAVPSTTAVREFHRMLYRHPSRRSHPLRRKHRRA